MSAESTNSRIRVNPVQHRSSTVASSSRAHGRSYSRSSNHGQKSHIDSEESTYAAYTRAYQVVFKEPLAKDCVELVAEKIMAHLFVCEKCHNAEVLHSKYDSTITIMRHLRQIKSQAPKEEDYDYEESSSSTPQVNEKKGLSTHSEDRASKVSLVAKTGLPRKRRVMAGFEER